MIEIWTDGSHHSSRNIGAWAYMLVDHSGGKNQDSGAFKSKSSVETELRAVYQALLATPESQQDVVVYTDSMSVIDVAVAIDDYAAWDFRRSEFSPKPMAYDRIWKKVAELLSNRNVTFKWVKGHSGNNRHDQVDRLARRTMRKEIRRS